MLIYKEDYATLDCGYDSLLVALIKSLCAHQKLNSSMDFDCDQHKPEENLSILATYF